MFSCFGSRPRREEVGTEPPVNYKYMVDPIRKAAGIPVRLTSGERKAQRLIRGITLASNYTDKVDVEMLASTPPKRQAIIAKELSNALVGLVVAYDLEQGGKLLASHDLSHYKNFLTKSFELMRRYKIMNPDLLRTDYVKFLYMMQDASSKVMKEELGFCISSKPVMTVVELLEQLNCPELLEDPRLPVCITPVPKIANRSSLNKALRFKDVTVSRLVKDYAEKCGKNPDFIELAVRSLNDANSFANDNVDSTKEMLDLLRQFYSADPSPRREVDLSIKEGDGGSRLTHEHAMQFNFVLQSLTLWKLISSQMYELWLIAEKDMLDEANPYEFRNTGQGCHRVQPAPNLYTAVDKILQDAKSELNGWVGSEKIHMGDNQVPNAFYFIDKYAQISRIIIPILRAVSSIETIVADPHKKDYVKEVWGSVDGAKVAILTDFFRHGFDGSGGDNMEDAGSCIDGRLTSAWNWCNSIRDKPYYPLFLLAGFNSFDGDLTL